MGGVSESTFQIDRTGGENGEPTGLFKGLWQLYIILSMHARYHVVFDYL